MSLKIGTVEPTEIKVIENGTTTDSTVYEYATTGTDLKEATRSAVSTYTKANLDGYVGLENDTWSGITNASSLVANEYYYIRVLVSDTNKYGKFCVRFKSYSGQTITVDNMGWGYDGEVIYSTPVWGKPYSLILKGSNCTITVSRKSSPNEHATEVTLTSGSKIYYGDTINISIVPTTSQYALASVKINGVEQSDISPTFEKDFTVTESIVVTAMAGESTKTWVTKFSGSKTFTTSGSLANDPITQEFPTNNFEYTNIPLSNFGITESATTSPIRITATITVGVGGPSITKTENTTLSARQLSTSWTTVTNTVSTTVGTNNYSVGAYGQLRAETTNLGLGIYMTKARNLTMAKSQITIVVTKVEQYLSSGTVAQLSKPIIDNVSRASADELEFQLQNTNDVAVTANIKFADAYNDVTGANTATVAANSYQRSSVTLSSSGDYEAGWTLEVYYTASGYKQSDTTTYTGKAM